MESRGCRKLGVGVFHTRRVEMVRYSQVHRELRLAWFVSDLGYNEVNYLINFKRIPRLLCGLLGTEEQTEEVSKALPMPGTLPTAHPLPQTNKAPACLVRLVTGSPDHVLTFLMALSSLPCES